MDPEQLILLEKIQIAARHLGEHCDSVAIFVTQTTEAAGTGSLNHMTGNVFALESAIRDWVIEQEETLRFRVRERLEKERED